MRISVFPHMETETQGYSVPWYSVPAQWQQYFYLEPFLNFFKLKHTLPCGCDREGERLKITFCKS